MKKRTLFFAACFLVTIAAGCEEGKKAVKEKQKEIGNKVGGAPKRTIDDVTRRANAAVAKGIKRIEEADAEANK